MNPAPKSASPLSQFEMYRAVSWIASALTLGLIFNQHPYLLGGLRHSVIVVGLGFILFAFFRNQQHVVLLLVIGVYVFAERNALAAGAQRPLRAEDFWFSGALLCAAISTFRTSAAQAPIAGAPQQAPLFQRLIRRLRRRPPATVVVAAEFSPAEVGELVRMAALLPLWILLGHTIYRVAPVQAIEAFQLPLAPQFVLLVALLLLGGSVVVVARVVLGSIERERLDPLCAELELNDLVWRELRPELRGIGNSLGKASRREKK